MYLVQPSLRDSTIKGAPRRRQHHNLMATCSSAGSNNQLRRRPWSCGSHMGLLMEKSICAHRVARLHCILLVPPATFLRAQQYCTAQQYCRYDHAALHISLPTSLIPTAPLLQCSLTFALSGLTCSVLSHHSMLRAYSSCWKAARARLDIRATCTHTYKRRCHGLNQADR